MASITTSTIKVPQEGISIIKPSTGGKNARLPSSSGGGANPASTGVECTFGKRCEDMHCQTLDKKHGPGFIRATTCWRIKRGNPCNICNPNPNREFCQFGENCKFKDTTCRKVHQPTATDNSANAGKVCVSLKTDDFPSLGGKAVLVEAVPLKSDKDSTGTDTTWANVAAKSGGNATSSSEQCGVQQITGAIGTLNDMAFSLPVGDRAPITQWVVLLTTILNVNNLNSLPVRATLEAAVSFCVQYKSELQASYLKKKHLKTEQNRSILLDPMLFNIQTMAIESQNACMAHALAWSLFHGQNRRYLDMFQMSLLPNKNVDYSVVREGFLQSFTGIDEVSLANLSQRFDDFGSIQNFRRFLHEINRMFIEMVSEIEMFISEETKPKYRALIFFMTQIMGNEVDPNTMNDDEINSIYSIFLVCSESFASFFKEFEDLFFDVKSSDNFFNMFVRAMTTRLVKPDSELLKNGLLSGEQNEEFFTQHLVPIFTKAFNRTSQYLLHTDEVVFKAVKSFSETKKKFLSPELVDFLFSTFETGGNEGRLAIVKLIDHYFNVIEKYFGIVENLSEVPFGKGWFLKYKTPLGDRVSEDVSEIVGEYIFRLVCVAKVLIDDGKELSVKFGNCGVVSKRRTEETNVSISFLFDEIGIRLLDNRHFGFVKPTKDSSEKVPNVFEPSIVDKVRKNKKMEEASRGDIMKHFFESSIEIIVHTGFETQAEKQEFRTKVDQVMGKFREAPKEESNPEGDEAPKEESKPDNDFNLYLFLSMFKRNANDKLQMCLVEFLLHEPCKMAFLEGLTFVDQTVSETMRAIVSDVLRFSTNILPSSDNQVITDICKAFRFIIESGVTLDKVLDTCTVIKSLFNANKTTMVFINAFGVALMTAASKSLGLKFSTMYACMTDTLNPINRVVKDVKEFKQLDKVEVGRVQRFHPNFFTSCHKPSPDCIAFCSDATSLILEAPENIQKFKDMVKNLFPLVIFSSIHHKSQRTATLTFSLSDIFDRISMVLVARNRVEILDQLGLIKKDPLNERQLKESQNWEDRFFKAVSPSLTTSTITAFSESLKRYMVDNKRSIEELLQDAELKTLKASFRMESQIQSLYGFLRSAGILKKEIEDLLNTQFVRDSIMMTNWRGQQVLDIKAFATVISAQNTGASESFVLNVFSIVNKALYPNRKGIIACREIMNTLYSNRNVFLQMQSSEIYRVVQSSSCLPKASVADIAFGNFDEGLIEGSFAEFMKLIDSEKKKTIIDRITNLPVTLMSKEFLGALSSFNTQSSNHSILDAECMTNLAKEMLVDAESSAEFVSYFSDLESYIITVFYDDEDEHISLEEIRVHLKDHSTKLYRAFNCYVEASIKFFEQK